MIWLVKYAVEANKCEWVERRVKKAPKCQQMKQGSNYHKRGCSATDSCIIKSRCIAHYGMETRPQKASTHTYTYVSNINLHQTHHTQLPQLTLWVSLAHGKYARKYESRWKKKPNSQPVCISSREMLFFFITVVPSRFFLSRRLEKRLKMENELVFFRRSSVPPDNKIIKIITESQQHSR